LAGHRLLLAAAIAFTALTARLDAQSRPEPPPTDPNDPKQETTVVLSPFFVSTGGDIGYLAQSSVAGSRLNTNLGDLATPVTAFTQEFLADIAVTNVDDLTQFMVNTKTDYPEGDALFKDADSQRFKIRGLPAFNYSVNFFQTTLRLDTYNTERVEQSRGPNSILFGLGSPGGLVNVSTKRAIANRHFGSVTVSARSHNGLRTALDYNHALVPGRFSLRLAAVRDTKDTWRHREYDHQRRLYVTALWQVAKNTRVDAEWEHGLVNKALVQPMIANDAYTPWMRAGRRLSDTANAALGIRTISAVDWNVIDTATGQLSNWRGKTQSSANTIGGAAAWLTDFSVLPKDVALNSGAAFPQNTNYTRGCVFVTHAFSRDFNLEFAANGQWSAHNAVAGRNAALLEADTSVTLPNGQPNPNAGRAFVDQFPGTVDEYLKANRLRLTAAYTRDLGRWGRHQIAALAARDWSWLKGTQLRPAIVDNPYNTTDPANGANNLRFRTYFDLTGPHELMGAGDWRPFIVAPPGNIRAWENFNKTQLTDAYSGRMMGVKWISNAVPQDNRFEQRSAMAVLQSHFFGGRLVTVAGYRSDWQDGWYSLNDSALARARPYGSFTSGEFTIVPATAPIQNKATNFTYSGVFRVTKQLALTYNRAVNSSLPDPNGLIVGADASGRLPAPRGRSQDLGIKFGLGHRFSLNALYYETSATKDTANSNPTIEGRYTTIWTTLNTASVMAPGGGSALNVPQRFNRYTFDSSGKGYELELIANPRDHLRIFLNFSDGVVKQTNIGREAIDYFAEYRSYWTQGTNGNLLVAGTGLTIAQTVAAIEQEIQNLYITPEGQQGRGQVPRQFNLMTNYSFTKGPLKGCFVGGGTRHRSGEIVEFQISTNASTGAVTRQPVHGRTNTIVDFLAGYRGRFKVLARAVRWNLQLNVSNLLDNQQMLPTRQIGGAIITYRLQPPREYTLGSRFDF
jgi:outer membrane receptor protein involved in Fe transport